MARQSTDLVVKAASKLIFERLQASLISECLLDEFFLTTSGGTPNRQNGSYYGGEIPWIKSGELNDGLIVEVGEYLTEEGLKNSSAKIFPKGTLVVALYGATVGKTGILAMDAATNQAVCALFPRTDKVHVEFMHWFLRSKRDDFLKLSFGGAQPNISQKILRETRVPIPDTSLQTEICRFLKTLEENVEGTRSALPPLSSPLQEIPEVVARIEALAGRVAEAQRLRAEIPKDAQLMLRSAYHDLIVNASYQRMSEVAPLVRRPIEVEDEQNYHELGIRSFGKGTFHKPPIKGIDIGTKRIFQIEPGDLLFSNVFAWEGAIAVVKPEDQGRVGSHRFISCVPKAGVATSKFLCFHFLTPKGMLDINEASPGGAGRNRTLGLTKLEAINVPLPSYDRQLWFDSIIEKVEAISIAQSENQSEFDALLPAILDKAFRGEL